MVSLEAYSFEGMWAVSKCMTWAYYAAHSSVTCTCFCSHMFYFIHVTVQYLAFGQTTKNTKKYSRKNWSDEKSIDNIHSPPQYHRFVCRSHDHVKIFDVINFFLISIQLFSFPFAHFHFIVVVLVRWPRMDVNHNSSSSFCVVFFSKFIENLKQPHEKYVIIYFLLPSSSAFWRVTGLTSRFKLDCFQYTRLYLTINRYKFFRNIFRSDFFQYLINFDWLRT